MSTPLNWFTVEQAAKVSGYHENYIRRLARREVLEGQKVGPIWLINPESLRAYTARMKGDGDPRSGPRSKKG